MKIYDYIAIIKVGLKVSLKIIGQFFDLGYGKVTFDNIADI
jgi:hypothetical protein